MQFQLGDVQVPEEAQMAGSKEETGPDGRKSGVHWRASGELLGASEEKWGADSRSERRVDETGIEAARLNGERRQWPRSVRFVQDYVGVIKNCLASPWRQWVPPMLRFRG